MKEDPIIGTDFDSIAQHFRERYANLDEAAAAMADFVQRHPHLAKEAVERSARATLVAVQAEKRRETFRVVGDETKKRGKRHYRKHY